MASKTEMDNVKLVATDLDGTFLKNDRTISELNLQALHKLGEKRIARVVATGRNLKKVREVISRDIPFDYIIYSSGAGVFNWRENIHLFNQNISKNTSGELITYFMQKMISFHAFFPAPENHRHWFFRGENRCEEFERYFLFNEAFAVDLQYGEVPDSETCQFLLIIPEDVDRFEMLKSEIELISEEIRVIRTSSPITKGYIWIEVFHRSVSKGSGVQKICDLLGINQKETLGLGNDYNDLDLLEFTQYSFLTDNAPSELKNYFPVIPSNDDDAFAFAVQPIIT